MVPPTLPTVVNKFVKSKSKVPKHGGHLQQVLGMHVQTEVTNSRNL